MELLDAEGGEIRASFFNEAAEKFYDLMEVGSDRNKWRLDMIGLGLVGCRVRAGFLSGWAGRQVLEAQQGQRAHREQAVQHLQASL